MHQIVIRLQGGDGASAAAVIAALDLAKGRLMAGISNGQSRCGDVGFDFEAREVDAEHAFQELLSTPAPADAQDAASVCEPMGEVSVSDRGLERVTFADSYDTACVLACSSAVVPAVWLGLDKVTPRILAREAHKHGVMTAETTGWVDFPVPSEVLMSARMHLRREQVEGLVWRLQQWLEHERFNA